MVANSETARNRILQMGAPVALRMFTIRVRPNRPFAVQWRIDGKPKTKTFASEEQQQAFAEQLTAGAGEIGLDAYRLNPDETRQWRAFRARVGTDTPLDAVALCWERHGRQGPALPVSLAVEQFLAAKRAEGVAEQTLAHYGPVYGRLCESFGKLNVAAITRQQMSDWLSKLDMADESRRTHFKRAKQLFDWLRDAQAIAASPLDGLKAVRVIRDEVQTWTVDEFRALFHANENHAEPETLGRLACECFAGLRFSSAAKLEAREVEFENMGISLPAAKIKTRRRQFVDGLPDNLWHWLRRSEPAKWQMTPRQYLTAKGEAIRHAKLRLIHNACRHGFGTYHMAAHKDAPRTAAILCHTSPKMLYEHYKGRATEAEGRNYFLIYPTGANSPRPVRTG